METNCSQKNLVNGLNELSVDKKVWTKPTVEMISRDIIASGAHTSDHEGISRTVDWNAYFAS